MSSLTKQTIQAKSNRFIIAKTIKNEKKIGTIGQKVVQVEEHLEFLTKIKST